MANVCPSCGHENAEPVKFCAECGEKLVGQSAGAWESRRTVTVLFADVTGSTALGEQLDPESMRTLMGRYFATIKGIIEHHGGTVEKFIGDAVMAVFGIPTRHEDDALRAVRAAAEIRDTLAGLNTELQTSRGIAIVLRTGVNTGEVVAGDPSAGQTLVTGDSVNTAARLEQAAQPGEILLGDATYRLVRDAVVAEPTEPIEAKGKTLPVAAHRLTSVIAGAAGHARRLDAPMVGRVHELQLLTDAYDRSVADRTGQLVTVLGQAGVGKSRLVEEFRQRIEGHATFLRGRCLSYGEGITYWPLADALRAPAAVDDEDSAESWRSGLLALIGDDPQAPAIAEQVMGLIGVAEAGGSEAFWAVRRLLEGMARQQPLVFVIDDLHWATPTYLDLVEHLVGWIRDASILIIGTARPELLRARPDWGGVKTATHVLLEPLDAEAIDQLLAYLLRDGSVGAGASRRIAAAAEGNPLFVEELVAMLAERGELAADPAELEVPATIEALMAARLDQLSADERAVLGRGSVIGLQFGAGEVARLSDEARPAAVRGALMAMVRHDLLRPELDATLPMGPDDEAFSFRHQLIRDAAYASLSKAERARLHERYADLLEGLPSERLRPLAEIVGYHLEQATLLQMALGLGSEAQDVATRAAAHLGGAGLRALERWDSPAAANLLGRATALLPVEDPKRIALLPHFARALLWRGHFDEGEAIISEALDATANGLDPVTRVLALGERAGLAVSKGATAAERMPDIEEAIAIAEATQNPALLAVARANRALMALQTGRLGDARQDFEFAIDAGRRSGDTSRETFMRGGLAQVTWMGTNAGSDLDLVLADTLAFAREHGLPRMEADILRFAAVEAARRDQLPEARRLMAQCLAVTEAAPIWTAGISWERGYLEFLAGDAEARERVLREGYDKLDAMGERGVLSSIAADLADALVDLGRIDEADAMCRIADEAGAPDDVTTQVGLNLVRGRLAALRGNMDDALTSVADAQALADGGDVYHLRALPRLVLAQLLHRAGRIEEARASAQEVVDLARHRGDVVFERRARDILERTALGA